MDAAVGVSADWPNDLRGTGILTEIAGKKRNIGATGIVMNIVLKGASSLTRDSIFKVTLGAVLLIGVEVAAYGLYLLFVGIRWTGSDGTTWLEPHPGGYIALVGAGLLLLGLGLRNVTVVWVGGTVIALFSGLFFFSVGGILIPVGLALLLLLGVMTWTGKLNRRSTF